MLRERMSYSIMCTMYVTHMYAYIPVQLYVDIQWKFGAMCAPLQNKTKTYTAVSTTPYVNPANVM